MNIAVSPRLLFLVTVVHAARSPPNWRPSEVWTSEVDGVLTVGWAQKGPALDKYGEVYSTWNVRTQSSEAKMFLDIAKDIRRSLVGFSGTPTYVLMLGLGGGSLAGDLLCHPSGSSIGSIIAVELDPRVIDVFGSHFSPAIFSGTCAAAQHKLEIMEGNAFAVEQMLANHSHMPFTHVVVDINPLSGVACFDGPSGWFHTLATLSTPNARIYINTGTDAEAEIQCANSMMRTLQEAGWGDTRLTISRQDELDNNAIVSGRLLRPMCPA